MNRTIKEALRIAQSPENAVRFHHTIARHGYATDGAVVSTGEPNSLPEKPQTIAMQLRQLVDGKRAGVFVANGSKHVSAPKGVSVVPIKEGHIFFNPEVISRSDILNLTKNGRINEILGYVQSKREAISDAFTNGQWPIGVVSRDKNGVEQDSAMVGPGKEKEQAQVFADRAKEGSTVGLEDVGNIIAERMGFADGGVPEEESQEEFLKKELEGSAPQYDPEAGMLTGKRAGLMAAGFAPGSGIASAAGKFPTAEGGYEPSLREDIKEHRYGSAFLKALGAAGDVAYAAPVVGTAVGAAMKAPLAAKLVMAAAPVAKAAHEIAPVAKAAEEAAPVAKAVEEIAPEIKGFKTSKGSTYELTPEGITIRNKAARPEHPGEEGIQPPSKRTIYMTPEEMNKLADIQAISPHERGLTYHDDTNSVGMIYHTGPDAGKIEKRTVAKFSTRPEVGLHPVEDFGGKKVHFGNQIVELFHPEKPAEAAPALTKTQSQEAMKKLWAEGKGNPQYNNPMHQWNVEEKHKFETPKTEAPAKQVEPKKQKGFELPEPYERVTNPAGFYSHGAEAARALPQQKGTLEQMLAALKSYGVKPEEIRWSNVEKAFAGKPQVTGEELAQHFESALPRVNRVTKEPFDYNDYDAWDEARERAWDHVREDYPSDMERMIDDWKEENPGEWESMDDAQRQRLQENLDTEWYENNDEYVNELADNYVREEAENRGPKWGDDAYNFPGGEDYFENILTIPTVKGDANYFHPQVYDDATRATRDQLESDYHKLSLDHNVAEMEIRNAIDAEQYRLSRKVAEKHFKNFELSGFEFATPEERQAAFNAWKAADEKVEAARQAYKDGAESGITNEELVALRDNLRSKVESRDAYQYNLNEIDKRTRDGVLDNLYDEARKRFIRSPKSLFEELGLWDEYEALSNPPGYAELAEKHQNARQKLNDFNAELINRSQEIWAKDPHNYERELYRNTTHWPGIDNPILHNRFKTYRQNGKKILNKSEAQSDWAKEDFNAALSPSEEHELIDLFDKDTRTPEENLRATHLLSKQNLHGKTKEVPYIGSTDRWAELSAKDALTHALENDFDQIALTSGSEQAKRYSSGLRQAASNISWETYPDYIGPVPDVLAEPYAHAMFGKTWKELTYQEKNDAKATALEIARDAAPNLFPGNIHAIPRGAKKVNIKLSDGRDAEFMVSPVKQPNGNIKNIVVKSPGFSSTEGKALGSVIGSDLEKQVMGAESGDKKLNNYMMGSGGYDQIYEQALPKAYTKLFKALGFEPNIYKGKLKTPRARQEGLTLDEIRNIAFNMTPEQEAKFGDQMKNLIDVVERSDDQGYASSRFFERSADYDFTRFMHPFKSEANRDVTYIDIPPEMREKYEELKRDYGAVFPAYKRGGSVGQKDSSFLSKLAYNPRGNRRIREALSLSRKITEG